MDGLKIKEILSLNYKEGEKVKISPVGEVVGADRRAFKIDAKTILDSLAKNALHIPLDVNHSFGVAAGWLDYKSFEIREDGIYASLELNKQGKELVEEKLYRYLSPVYQMNERHEVVGIDSVGLVNRPNLLNNALNQKGDSVGEKEKKDEQELQDKKIAELKKELKAANEKIAELQKPDEGKDESATKEEDTDKESVSLEANNKAILALSENVTSLAKTVNDMQKKLEVFGKHELEKNDNQRELSESEKATANLLGISEDEYKGAR